MTTITHWVNNEVFAGASGATAPVTNPATGAVTGEVALASVEDARAVIDAAAAAFPAWRDTSLANRTQVLFAFRELLNARKDELAAIITAEHGKVLSDALGEVSRGQEVVEFACGIPHLLKGGFTENASTKVDVHSSASRWDRSASSPRSTSPPWCRCGSSPSPSRRQHRRAQTLGEGSQRVAVAGASCGPKPACPTACSTCCRATRPPSTSC